MERVLGTHCAEPNPMFGIEGYAYEFVIKEEIKQEDIGKYEGCIKVGQDKVIYSRRYYDEKFGCNIKIAFIKTMAWGLIKGTRMLKNTSNHRKYSYLIDTQFKSEDEAMREIEHEKALEELDKLNDTKRLIIYKGADGNTYVRELISSEFDNPTGPNGEPAEYVKLRWKEDFLIRLDTEHTNNLGETFHIYAKVLSCTVCWVEYNRKIYRAIGMFKHSLKAVIGEKKYRLLTPPNYFLTNEDRRESEILLLRDMPDGMNVSQYKKSKKRKDLGLGKDDIEFYLDVLLKDMSVEDILKRYEEHQNNCFDCD